MLPVRNARMQSGEAHVSFECCRTTMCPVYTKVHRGTYFASRDSVLERFRGCMKKRPRVINSNSLALSAHNATAEKARSISRANLLLRSASCARVFIRRTIGLAFFVLFFSSHARPCCKAKFRSNHI